MHKGTQCFLNIQCDWVETKVSPLSSNEKTRKPMMQYSTQVCNTLVSPYPLRLSLCFARSAATNGNITYVNRRKQLIHFISYNVNVNHLQRKEVGTERKSTQPADVLGRLTGREQTIREAHKWPQGERTVGRIAAGWSQEWLTGHLERLAQWRGLRVNAELNNAVQVLKKWISGVLWSRPMSLLWATGGNRYEKTSDGALGP